MLDQSPSGIELRVRRSIDDLSGLDIARLRRAFEAAMRTSDSHGYQSLAGIHGLPLSYAQHQNPLFLPWHRMYLVHFETALRTFEPGVALPWWDWSSDEAHEIGIPGAYAARAVDGKPNPLYAVEIDTKSWGQEHEKVSSVPSRTSRETAPASQLPGGEVIEELLAVDDFATFASRLENVHNGVHGWVGGTNAMVSVSSYDPFFWAYQATIDRIWWLWQEAHPEAKPPRSIAALALPPFPTTVEESWDTASLGYEYADRTTSSTAQTTSSAFLAGATSDLPATADQLNFADYAQAFAEIIASPHTTPPLTVGIYGSWGIGKSSLLEMIAGEFPEAPRRRRRVWQWWVPRRESSARGADSAAGGEKTVEIHVVEFNAWEYGSNERIWPGLVRRIMERMEGEAQWGFWARFADTLKRNLRRHWRRHRSQLIVAPAIIVPLALIAAWKLEFSVPLILGALAAMGAPGLLKLGTEAMTNPVSRWVGELVEQGEYGDELPYMREIHEDLRFLTRQMRSKGDEREPRVLVMIDDLDRCEPAKAVEMLQAINLLLDFPVFIVCLGIDARIITAAVEAHYNQLLGRAGASGYEYLDKIVQIPFRIPTASGPEVESFLESQMPVLAALDATESEPSVETDAAQVVAGTTYDRPAGGASAEEQVEQTSLPQIDFTMFDHAEVQGFQRLAPFIRRNPRHIKRLVNVYRMVRTLAARRGVQEILDNREMTIAWIVICAQWPYTVSMMLESFEKIVEAVDAGEDYPDGDPLPELYEKVKPGLTAEVQRQIDDDLEDLDKLLERTTMTWDQLRIVRPYTLNFNPAIEEALHRGTSPSPADSNSRSTSA